MLRSSSADELGPLVFEVAGTQQIDIWSSYIYGRKHLSSVSRPVSPSSTMKLQIQTLLLAATLLTSSFVFADSSVGKVGSGTEKPAKPQPPPPQPPDKKYFHEPGGNNILGHYDIRYYKGQPVSYDERGDTLYHMIRAYLSAFREGNVETWIAHGTLLGWWWNGKILPWDWDLDVQVSASTLTWLGENWNMTMHNYTAVAADGSDIRREYLLDINPNSKERVRGDGMNVIDARWIDVRNGLFIDITGLSETNPSTLPGIWSCKNYHRYRTRDLYPLRETVFEGVPALVPYSFDKILTEEYSSRALTSTFHEG